MRNLQYFNDFLNEGKDNWLAKIKKYFFGLKPGNLILRPQTGSDREGRLYMLVDPLEDNEGFIKVHQVGGIHRREFDNSLYCSLVFNTKNTKVVGIMQNHDDFTSYRKLKSEEIKMVKEALKESDSKRYIDIVKKNTGLDIKI